jgi:tetratricopeptide (TPR) repeat protein
MAGRHEWYRRTTWSEADQDDFRARLERSRTAGARVQYLRIQALYLEGAGLVEAAIELLREVLREYPESIEVALAHLQMATCHEKAGRIDNAVLELRRALSAEAKRPNAQISAWLEFGRIVVEHGRPDLFDEFLNLLEERAQDPRRFAADLAFPAKQYLLNACLAVIFDIRGEDRLAREHARNALAAGDAKHSGFRYHSTVGLLEDTNTPLYRRISALAADG